MIEVASPDVPLISASRRWTVVAICASALFLVGLDTTIVTVGLPRIGAGLGLGSDRLAWVVDAYTVPFASLLITSGALADRFGRRRVFQTGLVMFGLSSLAAAVAPSLEVLLAARVVQGVGASMLTPVALAIVVNVMTDPRERAQAIGIWGAMFGLSMAAGPVTGGALIAVFDWRAVFWINGPIVLAAILLVRTLVPESRAATPRRLDWPGQVLLMVALAIAVTVLIEAPRVGWSSPTAIVAYVAVLLTAVAFGWVESHRREPLIDPGLFRSAGFTGAVVSAVAVFVAFSMTLLLTTVLLQDRMGWEPVAAGAATLPMALGALVCAPVSGHLVGRIGSRLPLLTAGACLLLGGALLVSLTSTLSVPVLLVAYLLVGVGVGLSSPPITNAAVSSLPPERAGVAGGITSTARQIGTALGVALAGSLTATLDQPFTSLLGWLLVSGCGAAVLASALLLPTRLARPSSTGTRQGRKA
ncbi:MAG TPA: MFS transporter [Arachnia sp.]|nr:MFS transporter [Arachnia sp.]HMT85392.1 MFS transporter [Arachnia sp.]